jgi:hypothetical protein
MEILEFTYKEPCRVKCPILPRLNNGKTYPRLTASSICSVQPLSGPTGLIFYLRWKYANNKGCKSGK